jgi:hypothetical protein
MPYSVTIPSGASYVLVTVDEPYRRELAIEVTIRSRDVAAEHGLHRFLYDVRKAPNPESIVTNYEFMNRQIEPMGLDRSAWVAILAAVDDHSHDFVETAGVNAGYRIRIFRDEEAALRWLAA